VNTLSGKHKLELLDTYQILIKIFGNRHGDWVQFNVAVDRRDKLERATNIELLEESFLVSGEKRETGVVAALKEGYGFIRCAERDARVSFDVLREMLVCFFTFLRLLPWTKKSMSTRKLNLPYHR